jgi:hypothetical protein
VNDTLPNLFLITLCIQQITDVARKFIGKDIVKNAARFVVGKKITHSQKLLNMLLVKGACKERITEGGNVGSIEFGFLANAQNVLQDLGTRCAK